MAGLPRDRDPHQRPARGAGLPCPGLEKDTGDRSSLLLRPKQLAHNTQCRKRCATLQQYQDIFHLNSKTTTTTSATPSLMPEIKTCSKNRKCVSSSSALVYLHIAFIMGCNTCNGGVRVPRPGPTGGSALLLVKGGAWAACHGRHLESTKVPSPWSPGDPGRSTHWSLGSKS